MVAGNSAWDVDLGTLSINSNHQRWKWRHVLASNSPVSHVHGGRSRRCGTEGGTRCSITHFTLDLSWDSLEGSCGRLPFEVTLEVLAGDTWLDTESIKFVSTSVEFHIHGYEVEELVSSSDSSLGNSWHVLGVGVTQTTRCNLTNRKNEVSEVLSLSHFRALLGWDTLDS